MGAVSPDKLKKISASNKVPQNKDSFASGGKVGLYANIHAKRKRIEGGSGETMRKKGDKGAPTNKAFQRSSKTAK